MFLINNIPSRSQKSFVKEGRDDEPMKFLPYQLWMVVQGTTMVITGNGQLGLDTGEGA